MIAEASAGMSNVLKVFPGNFPDGLDVLAICNDGRSRLAIQIANPHGGGDGGNDPVAVSIDLGGGGSRWANASWAQVAVLAAKSPTAVHVTPVSTRHAVPADGMLELVLPPYSFTTIAIDVAPGSQQF